MDEEKKWSAGIRKHKRTIAFTACLTAFTVFISLDTFVLSSAYQTGATQMDTSMIQTQEKTQAKEKGQDAGQASDSQDTKNAQDDSTGIVYIG